jgi:glycosyltransferase involved in cell wall biosynthesis
VAHALVADGYPRARIAVVENAIELSPPDPHEPPLAALLAPVGLAGVKRLIGTVGNLREVKNHALLISALAQIANEFPDVGAVVIGNDDPAEPGVRRELAAQIAAHGLGQRVALLGFRADVVAWLRQLQVFVLPSNSEASPNAVLEAMACAVPVIATRVGEIPTWITHGVDGWLIDVGDVAGLAAGLRHLLADPTAACAMGRIAAAKIIPRRSAAALAHALESLYGTAHRTRGRFTHAD